MIRVGFVLSTLDQGWTGGVNYYKSLLSAIYELPDRKIEPVLFIGRKTSQAFLKDFPAVQKIQLRLLDRWSFPWVLQKILQRITGRNRLLEWALNKNGIAVLSHSGALGAGASIKAMGWIPDFQHKRLPEFFGNEERAYRDILFRKICHGCDAVLLSSHAAQADLVSFMPECAEKSRVLQFVPDLKEEQMAPIEDIRKKYGIEGAYFHLPNQFWRHKNHAVVVEALNLLRQNGKEITVVCTGNTVDYRHPEYFNDIMQTVERYGLSAQFKVLGAVPRADFMAIMKNCVALINPSLFEGWSTTVEESRLLGKTILLSNIDVHVEQAPPNGMYFAPHDAAALALLLERAEHSIRVDVAPGADELFSARRKFAEEYQRIVLETLS